MESPYLEDGRNVVSDTVTTTPLRDGLHGHEQPKSLSVVGVDLRLFEGLPVRDGLQIRATLGLSIDLLELDKDALIVDGLASQARKHLQTFLVALLGGKVARGLGTDERKTKDDPCRDQRNSLD